mgnify:CR=1 FL=1|tara:strand:- start:314 stop:682 length:369 start_codon:yes stop_codon:yes gene_type:complete
MKYLLLLLLIPAPSLAQSVTPNFTSGTMTQTVTTSQTVTEAVEIERFGGDLKTWNGDNVKAVNSDGAEVNIVGTSTEFLVVDTSLPWQLDIVTRAAGVIETQSIERTIETDSTTNTLSVFAQ